MKFGNIITWVTGYDGPPSYDGNLTACLIRKSGFLFRYSAGKYRQEGSDENFNPPTRGYLSNQLPNTL